MNNNQDLETSIALAKKDIDNIGMLFNKLDANVEKISEVANNVSRLLALHEQRIDSLSSNDRLLDAKLEKTYLDFQNEMKDLYSLIRNNNRDLLDKMKSTEESIKDDIRFVKELIDRENKTMKDSFQEENESLKKSIAENNKRITALEIWRWAIVGGSVVLVFLLNKSPIALSFFS